VLRSATHPLPVLDKDDFVDFLRRVLPQHQTAQWDGKQGQEFYDSVGRSWAWVQRMVASWAEGVHIRQATGPERATFTIRVTWDGGATVDVALDVGQVVAMTPWGLTYRLTEPLTFLIGNTSKDVVVEAVWPDFAANVDPECIEDWALPGGVDPIPHIVWRGGTPEASKQPFLDAIEAGDITLVGLTRLTDGAIATLDLIGASRGLPRALNETDIGYRRRIRRLPLMLTPNAILTAVNEMLKPFGVVAILVEPWEYWWTVGDPDWGAIGDPSHPISRLRHFRIEYDDITVTTVDGLTIGDEDQGVIGEDPIGSSNTTNEGVLAGLNEYLKAVKAAGIWAEAYEMPLP
jgi:hypothetical protein